MQMKGKRETENNFKKPKMSKLLKDLKNEIKENNLTLTKSDKDVKHG